MTPVNEVFGTSEGQGMLRFYDADNVLFPVLSDQGTVWISTAERLRLAGVEGVPELASENSVLPLKGFSANRPVNLGWLLLPSELPNSTITLPAEVSTFVRRLVAVSDKLFHHLVNDHLEVRTSVAIDPLTGAAKETALFTYEAIPRGTVLRIEICIDERRGQGSDRDRIEAMLDRCFTGLKLLGVGGMGTRGFGRLEVFRGDGK